MGTRAQTSVLAAAAFATGSIGVAAAVLVARRLEFEHLFAEGRVRAQRDHRAVDGSGVERDDTRVRGDHRAVDFCSCPAFNAHGVLDGVEVARFGLVDVTAEFLVDVIVFRREKRLGIVGAVRQARCLVADRLVEFGEVRARRISSLACTCCNCRLLAFVTTHDAPFVAVISHLSLYGFPRFYTSESFGSAA